MYTYIGILFRGTRSNTAKKELVIFLKATVIDENSDHQKIINEFEVLCPQECG